ncbi:MAG: class I SAM-dependent methyltransferase, partial [Chloroflexi bacterium]|nr:class I SAM-dependent methyltransferase [Chloroflexota bacterium]
GQLLAGDREAYGYLPASVERFLTAPSFAQLMEQAGLQEVRYRLVGLGMVAIHIGVKP